MAVQKSGCIDKPCHTDVSAEAQSAVIGLFQVNKGTWRMTPKL